MATMHKLLLEVVSNWLVSVRVIQFVRGQFREQTRARNPMKHNCNTELQLLESYLDVLQRHKHHLDCQYLLQLQQDVQQIVEPQLRRGAAVLSSLGPTERSTLAASQTSAETPTGILPMFKKAGQQIADLSARTSSSLQVCTTRVLATRVQSSPPDVTSRITPVTTNRSQPRGRVSTSAAVASSLPAKVGASSSILGKCSAHAPNTSSVHSSSASSSSSMTVSPPSSLLVQPVASYLPVLPSVNLSSFPVVSPTSPSSPRKSSNSSPANIADCRPLLSSNRFTKTSDKSSTVVGKRSADEPLFRYVPKLNPKSPSMKKWVMSFKKGKASYKKIQQTLPSRSWSQQSSSSSSVSLGNRRYNDIDLPIWRPFSPAPCQVLDRALMDRNAKILTLRETEDSVDSFSREMSDMMRTDEISNSSVGGQVLDSEVDFGGSASFCTGSKIVSTRSEFDIMGSEKNFTRSVEAGPWSQDMQSRQNAVSNAKRKLFCSSSSNNKTIPFKKRFSLNVTKKPSKQSTTCTTTAAAEGRRSPQRRGQKLRQKKKAVGQVPEENSRRSSTRARNPLQKLSLFEDTVVQLGQILMLFMSSNLTSTTKLMHSSKQALLMEYAGLCYITAFPTACGVRLRKTSASRAPIPLDLEWMLSED